VCFKQHQRELKKLLKLLRVRDHLEFDERLLQPFFQIVPPIKPSLPNPPLKLCPKC